jgi:tRNA pseudouridine55 synthase
VNARPPKKPRDLIDGVLLIDKPVGLSSNDALMKVKRIVNAKKAGHTGTLDPFATGLLPLCFGEATKFSQDLLEADKTYLATVHLGITTTTGDTEGDVLETRDVAVTTEQVEAALARFRGPILQVPPMYSALKRDGKALYEYAREGVTLEREARPVTVHELEMVAIAAPFLTIRVKCSKGTYVRVLGEDIGATLGCGAHLSALRRVQVGPLTTENMVTLEQLQAIENPLSLLAPVDALLSTFPRVDLTPELEKRFLNGQRLALGKEPVTVPRIEPDGQGRVRVYSDGRLLGTAVLQEYAILAPERLIAAKQ